MQIENQTFDEERALYNSKSIVAINCKFDGPADGESAFKESSNIIAQECYFNLRYPFWHNKDTSIINSQMTNLCRAALWYSNNLIIQKTQMHGIKALRECDHILINSCDIVSPEFGWSCKNININTSTAKSEYFLMRSKNVQIDKLDFEGKYSFQYVKNGTITASNFNTKDAFWHAENLKIKNCKIKGEYLGWYSKNLTFENCIIEGTQPFCYCKNLKLINCQMNNCDLAFEKSSVHATITTKIDSIKNPESGKIVVPCVGEIILDNKEKNKCRIIQNSN